MSREDRHVLAIRVQLRLEEAHREREGSEDLWIGQRNGLLQAMNILRQVNEQMDLDEDEQS